ncbi:hypothetical protein [Methylobacterium sp. PvR107]|uniref:hypothetical protein n=1 Tax=Methylobacterium sp. PvR107 TaxID=2806597 RepID=UPI001AE5E761|nr:hypothetical protein [Methylobacterium sp. PvR107]MBP1180035.1 hypothetical protein [Methylobacterium sp. PvR107]
MSAERDQQLAEALNYLRMPEVTNGKYAVVPVKGDRAAVAVIEATIAEMRAEIAEAEQAAEAMREACAKFVERDRRSDLAKRQGYFPKWQGYARELAAGIRALPVHAGLKEKGGGSAA